MLKILHIITGLDFGGAEKLLLDTCKEQARLGHSINVIFFQGDGPLRNEFEKFDIKVTKYDITGINLIISFLRLIISISKNRFSVVHTHLPRAAFIGRFAAYIAGCKRIVNTIHRIDPWYIPDSPPKWLLNLFDTFLNNLKASRIIAVSFAVKEFVEKYEKGIRNENIFMIYNAINFMDIETKLNESLHRSELGLSPDDFVVICVGWLDRRKGHIVLLEALDRLINEKRINNIKCLLVGGDGDCKDDLIDYIIKHKLEQHVYLTGIEKNPYKFMKVSDLFIIPSVLEPFGIIALEAYYLGIPVLSSDADGLAEIVKHGVTGIQVPLATMSGRKNANRKASALIVVPR